MQRSTFSISRFFRVDWNELAALLRIVIKWLVYCAAVAGLSGTASALFLFGLSVVTKARVQHLWLLWLLPCFGLLTNWVYHRYGGASDAGMHLILNEIDAPSRPIPLRMSVLSAWGTLMTQLGGGSVGVEATGVQMASSLADRFGRAIGVSDADRPVLLTSAIAAGFGSIFGTPVAGALFAIEVADRGKPEYRALFPALLSSFLAERVATEIWHVSRPQYVMGAFPEMNVAVWLKLVVASIVFALAARVFSAAVHRTKERVNRRVTYPPLRPVLGGILIVILTLGLRTRAYSGLGTPMIQQALLGQRIVPLAFALKILFTTLALGFGFVGGEVTPLFFIGATLGSVLGGVLNLPSGFLAAVGFAAVFAGATHAPLAGTFVGVELFGGQSLIYLATACIVSHVITGSQGLYVNVEARRNPQMRHDEQVQPVSSVVC